MRAAVLALGLAAVPGTSLAATHTIVPPRLVDGFESVTGWTSTTSDGVTSRISLGTGCRGNGLRFDYDFGGGAGYAVARRALRLRMPPNWAFSFCLRAEGATNDLELKFLDASGSNVWWWRRKSLAPSQDFERVVVKKRHVSFAWGPALGGDLKDVFALEIAVVAGSGGKGSLFLDELAFDVRPPPGPPVPPKASASSSEKGFDPSHAVDGRQDTSWRSASTATGPQWLQLDLDADRELGGLVVSFESGREPRDFAVEVSDDGASWRTVRQVSGNGRTTSWIALPELDARHLRLSMKSGGGKEYGIAEIDLKPPSFSKSPDTLIEAMAKESLPGRFPRGFSGQQTYWTVAGVDGGDEEVLVGEDGALEPGKGTFSLEPFLKIGDTLLDWHHVETSHSLAAGFVPIPTVTWVAGAVQLEITPLVDGSPAASVLRARYRVRNSGTIEVIARLFIAIRPFLVNPPIQFLNAPHGVSPIRTLAWDGRAAIVNGARSVVPVVAPAAFGAMTFDEGDLVDVLAKGEVPQEASVKDFTGLASGAFAWNLVVPPGGSRDVVLAVPLAPNAAPAPALQAEDFDARLQSAVDAWKEKLDRVKFRVPPAAESLVATLRSNLGYVLINRDGPRIQPGSRAYERSWIRDGALTSSALLRLGHAEEVREFLTWFAGFQFPSGKIPCCVDARGADPVPENDSHGEFLFLAGEYYRFTNDFKTIEALWPRIEKSVGFIDSLRKQRRTPEYAAADKRMFYGLLPESISHEGYSDKPVHSYWDDFFALKGLKDAADLARTLGKESDAAAWTAIRDEFRNDLHASLRLTIAANRLDFLPGSVEHHDFDPSATTTMLSPGGEQANLPQAELMRTFERYVEESRARRDGKKKSDAYTPYEIRTVGALVRLGKKAEAHEMLDFFMKDRRPAAWNQWAEVVGADARGARFIGDMPHTWVGTDFIRSFLDFFSYEREADGALVLGAGLPAEWVRATGGVGVTGLRTPFGHLDFSVWTEGVELRARIRGVEVPPGGLLLMWPLEGVPRTATVNGKPAAIHGGGILVREIPAEVVVRP